jgi:hypothetical protein
VREVKLRAWGRLQVTFQGDDSAPDVVSIASEYVHEHFSGMIVTFVGGSLIRGDGNRYSDIDLVIILPGVPNARRLSSLYKTSPIESFIHDEATLRWFAENDAEFGSCDLISVIAEGVPLGNKGMAAKLKRFAHDIITSGPPATSNDVINNLRYHITELADDLRGANNPQERMAIATALYDPLGQIILRGRNLWTGHGKWIPRLISKFDSRLGERFSRSFASLFQNAEP